MKLAALAFAAGFIAAAALNVPAADMNKVLRTAYRSGESKLDPQAESDEASGIILDQIFDSLLEYDYLARPAKLRPRAAAALPEVNSDGTVYVLHVKPGVYFTDDPALNGKKRELTAQDYAYSIRRLYDPKLKSQWLFLVEGKIKGADTVMADARKTNRYDYDRPIDGLRAIDRYTLRIELNTTDFGFPYVLAMPATSAVAREVAEYYGDDFQSHPVGTGPYLLKSWTRGSKIVLEANPGFRQEYFEGEAGDDPRSHEIAARLKGQRLPIVGRIEIYVIDEDQPRWLAFLNNEHDYIRPVPEDFGQIALPNGELAPNLKKRGITTTPDEIAWVTYTTFNLQTEIDGRKNDVGGYSPERIALRRAIAMAYRIDEQVALLDKFQSVRAYTPLPPAVAGYDPKFVSPTLEYNPARAKALLDMFGFVDRDGDGYRENPDGSPLVLEHAWYPTLRERQRNQLWKRSMDDIGIRVTFDKVEKLPELRKQARFGKVPSISYGWIADYPDGENFLQLMWKGSIGQANYAMFDLPEYNELYEKAKRLPDGPERNAVYAKMVKLICVYVPWMVETYKMGTILMHPWLLNYRKHPFGHEPWRYVDIDLARQPK
ncbi:MAG TPA: ABC transporter substrate-binding protein [Usitatibacter sp.]|jgi:ABC-type transport system substrate-binding protein|nr:ABC transporter substrate-binding protein [Usitatibacter sp.]